MQSEGAIQARSQPHEGYEPDNGHQQLSLLVDTLEEHTLFIDCSGTIAAAKCRQTALSARNLRAHLWHKVWLTWEAGPPVQKTRGHTTKTDIDAGRGTWWEKHGNDLADHYAKLGADAHGELDVCSHNLAALTQITLEATSWAGWQEKTMTKRAWRDSQHFAVAEEGRPPKAALPRWQLPVWKGMVPLSVEEDSLFVYPVCALARHKLRVARLDNGTCLLACIACGAYAGSSPRQLLAACAGRHAGPGLLRQRSRLLAGKHPHSSHGSGARVCGLSYPSASQVAWLLEDIKPTPARVRGQPVEGIGLDELFSRFGVPQHEDRVQWAQRAKGKKAECVVEDSGSE